MFKNRDVLYTRTNWDATNRKGLSVMEIMEIEENFEIAQLISVHFENSALSY